MPMSAKKNVNTALITITPKMAHTTAVVVRAPTAAAPPNQSRPPERTLTRPATVVGVIAMNFGYRLRRHNR